MFITFEGPDGAGKTTQISLLHQDLIRRGLNIFLTREPGGNKISEAIRDLLHNPDNTEMSPRTEVLLYSAARAQHVDQSIFPALKKGMIVLCDRFYDSTLAYQGFGRELDIEALKNLTAFATDGIKPNLTIYIEISPEEGLRRRRHDSEAEWNRLDREAISFHNRVHEGYLALIREEPERWVVVDGERAPEIIANEISEIVLSFITDKGIQ